jgi:hypothetical protein
MLQEIQAGIDQSRSIGEPLTLEEVWQIGTTEGAESVGVSNWSIRVGHELDVLSIPAAAFNKLA